MQLNLSTSLPLIQRNLDTDRLSNRAVRPVNENQREQVGQTKGQGESSGEAPANDVVLSSSQRVNASASIERNFLDDLNSFSDIAPENRRAVESYLITAQVTATQDRSELAGVDVFV